MAMEYAYFLSPPRLKVGFPNILPGYFVRKLGFVAYIMPSEREICPSSSQKD